jgi:hypothetical protein
MPALKTETRSIAAASVERAARFIAYTAKADETTRALRMPTDSVSYWGDVAESGGQSMARMDRTTPQPCRCELLQMTFEGISWPMLSVEHLLDRLTDPSGRASDLARNQSTNEGTSR